MASSIRIRLRDRLAQFQDTPLFNILQNVHRGLLYVLGWLCIQVTASLVIGGTTTLAGILIFSLVSGSAGVLLGIPLLVFTLYLVASQVWRLCKWMRKGMKRYWRSQSAPHSALIETRDGFGQILFKDIIQIGEKVSNPLNMENKGRSLRIGMVHLLLAYMMSLLSFIFVIYVNDINLFSGLAESQVNPGELSLPVAVLSVLLGGVIGIVTLLLATISTSFLDAIVFSSLLLIPAIPGILSMQNLVHHVETLISDYVNGLDSNNPFTQLVFCTFSINMLYLLAVVVAEKLITIF